MIGTICTGLEGAGMGLPVLISIPHGGTEVPPEFTDYLRACPADMAEDIDHLTCEIFSLAQTCSLTFPWCRTLVDLNRRPEQLPPEHPDGIVKLRTCTLQPVFDPIPPARVMDQVVQRYYRPYHERIRSEMDRGRWWAALDCHSMAAVGPPATPDPGQRRPLVCLGNRWGESASDELTRALGQCLARELGLPDEQISLNRPYSGGYITLHYGAGSIPWIQIEFSRGLYLDGGLYAGRIGELNQRFGAALEAWIPELERLRR